jgi:hypothetical protein
MSNSYPMKGALHPPLPPAPDGLVYWGRTIPVKRPENNSKTEQTYITTGCFAPDAPDQTIEHLRWVGTLVADFDLADFYAGEILAADPKAAKALTTIKSAFPHLKDSEVPKVLLYKIAKKSPEKLKEIRAKHLARVREVVAAVAPDVSATKIVDSAWGLHVYWWLLVPAADAAAITVARDVNRRLVENIDRLAGYELADVGVHDTGTRILREIGTVNGKDIAGPREVVLVEETDARWVIGQSRIVEQGKPAPVAAPSPKVTAPTTTAPTALPKSVADVLAASPTARDLFDGKGKAATDKDGAPRDTSGSGYDFSLALLLARQGVSVDDAATAIYVRNAGKKDWRHATRTATKAAAMASSPSSSSQKPPPVFERGDEVEVGLHLLRDLGAIGPNDDKNGTLLVTEGGGQWYQVRADGLWEPMSTAPLHVAIQQYAGLPVGEKADPLRVSDRFTKGVMACAAARLDEPSAFERTVTDPTFGQALAVFADGTVITGDGSTRRCLPDDRVRVTEAIRTVYDPTAICPRWTLFLEQVWDGCPDVEERKAFLQEVLGAALFGVGTVLGKVPVLLGEGENGKSKLIGVIDALVHPSGRTASPPQALASEYHRAHLSVPVGLHEPKVFSKGHCGRSGCRDLARAWLTANPVGGAWSPLLCPRCLVDTQGRHKPSAARVSMSS